MTPTLERKHSPIDGFGIFTQEPITKNTIFYVVPLDDVRSHPSPRCACIGENQFVSDPRVLNWVNHSCEPNTSLDIQVSPPVLRAIQHIQKGEEITVDYSRTESSSHH